MRKLIAVNAQDRSFARHSYVLWFGACAPTYILTYANSLDSAIENAAEYLADKAPGHIMPAWGPEHTALVKEACEESGIPYPPPEGADMEPYYKAQESAEADLTYTSNGMLVSYEWGIIGEDMTREEIISFIKS